jgi:hypothetical protein
MITLRKIYTHEGILVHDEEAPYGIFLYNDIGNAPGYKPWDKLRIVEVLYVESKRRWFFASRMLKGRMKAKGRGYNAVGIPKSLRPDFIKAMIRLEEEHGHEGSAIMEQHGRFLDGSNEGRTTQEGLQENKEGVQSGRRSPAAKQQPVRTPESEEDEIDRLLAGMERGAKRDRIA